MTVTALIADDETALRLHLKRLLSEVWPELNIVGEACDGLDAIEQIRAHQPDIAFLDIRMPGKDGLTVAQTLPTHTRCVFITAFDQYAVQAFDRAAVDYLLKPVTALRLQETVQRLQQTATANPADFTTALQHISRQLQQPEAYMQWLTVTRGEESYMLSVDEVDYFQAADKYTTVISGNQEWLIRTPVKDLEQRLDPDQFWRIHRATIVRVSAIQRIEKDFRGRIQLTLHQHPNAITVSRNYAHRFKQM